MTFRCGHPRTPENSAVTSVKRRADGSRYTQCALCKRVRDICIAAERGQKRLNAGLHVDGRIGVATGWL